jgi:hypothetical protein
VPSLKYSGIAGNEGGSSNLAFLSDDFRRIARSTTSGSLLMLTTRWDIFLIIVPALWSGDSIAEGESDRFLEPFLRSPPGLCIPASALCRSSPSFEDGEPADGAKNRTLWKLDLSRGLIGVVGDPLMGWRWLGSVRRAVSPYVGEK